MQLDKNNAIVQLCAKGMEMEGKGEMSMAKEIFSEAWNTATTDFERLIAAHYVARHQSSVQEKLKWDETALKYALNTASNGMLPSLYLNIAKCYEELHDLDNAKANYIAAQSFVNFLPSDNYGNMIRTGISNGLARIS